MSSSFKFIDHTGDIAVEVKADSLIELFSISVFAWKKAVLEEESNVENSESRKINLTEHSLEELLVSFLSELNFMLISDKWMFNDFASIDVYNDKDWYLTAEIVGEKFNTNKHSLKTEIKAVTFHQMNIRLINDEYATMIVFDI